MAATSGSGWRGSAAAVLGWAAVAESGSDHPLARSILEAAPPVGQLAGVRYSAESGRGVKASLDDHSVSVGSPGCFEPRLVGPAAEGLAGLRSRGRTTVLVAVDDEVVGVLELGGRPRPGAAEALRRLGGAGVRRVAMLTGDEPAAALALGSEVGVKEVHAGLLPDDKLTLVRQIQANGNVVAMVGDGINDAPALAVADVGVAMGVAGSDVAIETADVALMTDDLGKLADAIRLSRATIWTIRQNVAISLVVVAALLLGVVLGDVQMAGGMLVHELSVLIVSLNGARLLRA